jgi:hypothetical protein
MHTPTVTEIFTCFNTITYVSTQISVKVSVAWYDICDDIETCKDGSDEDLDFCKGKCSLAQHM